jgi:type II secretory pathway pseudopilin PulG
MFRPKSLPSDHMTTDTPSTENPSDHFSSGDEGLGLIEVIIALLVSTIVLVAVGTILINSWVAQEGVTSTTQATNRGQLISSAVERAMRNAMAFQVTGIDGSELWVWTSAAVGAECQGFRLTDGQAQMKTSTGTLGSPADWPEWQDGVKQQMSASGTAIDFFREAGRTVSYTFDIRTDSAPVRFVGEASTRYASSGGVNPCWT